ncbi:rhomboid-like protein [Streptomyces sp. NPDC059175]|uniref:rhomboid-like protein n=1 Tax=Streptomyces sp. NPDC059175 TaxID=3346757 RepID=UPI0036B9DEE1
MQRLEPREPVDDAGGALLGGVPPQRSTPRPVPAPPDGPATESAPYAAAPWRRAARLLPGPSRTPFTFFYCVLLVATSLYAEYGDPATVSTLLRGSSTDVAHLAENPLLVMVASALWVAGGLASPYALGLVFVLTALERRVGSWRSAAVFLGGHTAATLATEIPVGLSVMAGQLPATSLHRLDYGISFGLLASVGALAGLLAPAVRTVLLTGVSAMLVQDLLAFGDPLSNWGHPLALLAGVVSWPTVRRWAEDRGRAGAGPGGRCVGSWVPAPRETAGALAAAASSDPAGAE